MTEPRDRLAELRARAKEHSRQLDAILWMGVPELAVRWGVSVKTVRKIPREKLPYLTLGASGIRRYDPADIEAFEAANKKGAA